MALPENLSKDFFHLHPAIRAVHPVHLDMHRIRPGYPASQVPIHAGVPAPPARPTQASMTRDLKTRKMGLPDGYATPDSPRGGNRWRRAAAGPTNRRQKSAGVGTGRRSGTLAQDSSPVRCNRLSNLHDLRQIEFLDMTGTAAGGAESEVSPGSRSITSLRVSSCPGERKASKISSALPSIGTKYWSSVRASPLLGRSCPLPFCNNHTAP